MPGKRGASRRRSSRASTRASTIASGSRAALAESVPTGVGVSPGATSAQALGGHPSVPLQELHSLMNYISEQLRSHSAWSQNIPSSSVPTTSATMPLTAAGSAPMIPSTTAVSTGLPPLTTAVSSLPPPAVSGSTPVVAAAASNPFMSPGVSGEC